MVSFLEQPTFLVGAERSGTTVLRLMLSHHPDITWLNEFEYAVDLIGHPTEWPPLKDYYAWLDLHRIFRASQIEINKELSYPELVNDFLVQHRDRAQKPIVGATVHRHFDRLLRIWPDARFVHLLRDGRDVARSNIGMGWAGNVWTGVERWIEAEKLWGSLQEKIPAERRIDVTYEALITDPERELTRICEFLGVSYCPSMMDYIQKTTYDTPDPKYIAQWRRKLSDWQIQLVESRITTMLAERGYELSGLPSLDITAGLQQRLQLHDWWERFVFRLSRHGLPLFIADYLSRKLGLAQWQRQVRLKLNAIQATHLK
ncbi:MAG: sulfotransferase [Leptolyngbyaceae cyanobacterium]